MLLEHLMNQTDAPLLERVLKFADAKQNLNAENLANIDTPGYKQKDLSTIKFMDLLRSRLKQRDEGGSAGVGFGDIDLAISHPNSGILSHDGNNRSMEQLAADQAKTGLMYTVVMELLRHQYSQMQTALKEHVS